MGSIDAGHFFQLTVQLLVSTINRILDLSGKADGLHGKGIVSVDGKESRGSKRKTGVQGEVTADTMNCQKETVAAIVAEKGDYVLALKGNQLLFHEEVREYFDEDMLEGLRKKEGCYKKTVELEHGGVATREYYITEDTGWFCESSRWKKLRSFGLVHKKLVNTDGTEEEENRYYICSIGKDAEEFERAARGHWGWK